MGIFSRDNNNNIVLENADLDCEPQGPSVTKSTVAEIDEHLSPGEKVHYVSSGTSFSINGEDETSFELRLVLSNKRILVKRSTGLLSDELQTINYEDVSSVNLRKGMIVKKIAVELQSATYGIGVTGSSDSNELKSMVEFIRKKSRPSRETQAGSVDGEMDSLDKIDKLRQLNEKGAISDTEFEEKKQDLLDQV